jgi:hypothetical protein
MDGRRSGTAGAEAPANGIEGMQVTSNVQAWHLAEGVQAPSIADGS